MRLVSVGALLVGLLTMLAQFVLRSPPLFIPTSRGMAEYSSEAGRFSIPYPIGWIITEPLKDGRDDPSIVAWIEALKLPPPGVSVIIRRSLVRFDSLEQTKEWGEQFNALSSGYREISTEQIRFSGEETVLVDYTFEKPPSPFASTSVLHCLDNYRFHNRYGYDLTFCAGDGDFSQLRPTFQRMMESFKYLDPG